MDYKELILDMLNRIIKLEKEVELLKCNHNQSCVDYDTNHNANEGQHQLCVKQSTFEFLSNDNANKQRDKTRYLFKGNIYLKNRLVFAVVNDYVSNHKEITCAELKKVFDKSLQGSIGVVEYESIAKQRKDYQVRFFDKENEILRLIDGTMLVCSQWGIMNISNFIKRAEQIGYIIEQIAKD